jgi:threonine dehydrogenase-like Zn-dependent dehydrogenase
VVIAPRLTCGQCRYCRMGLDNQCENYRTIGTTIDGAFAPYLLAPAAALYKISAGVPHDDAVFFEPLSCVVGAVARARIQPGDNVVIIGAGPMGMLFALMYKTMGAGRVCHVPQDDGFVPVARRQCLAVRAERHAVYTVALSARRLADRPGASRVRDVPQDDTPLVDTA